MAEASAGRAKEQAAKEEQQKADEIKASNKMCMALESEHATHSW